MTRNLFDSIKDRTDKALVGIGALEDKLKKVVPEIKRLQPVLDKNTSRLEAVFFTLEEVSELVKEIKSEIEAGSGHFSEGIIILDELVQQSTTQREEVSRLAMITRHVNFFLEDPNTLKEILWGVIKSRPEMKEIIYQWMNGHPISKGD